MKTKNRILTALGALGILIVFEPAQAQQPEKHRHNPEHGRAKIEEHITLTQEQKDQLQALHEQRKVENKDLTKGVDKEFGTADPKSHHRKKMQALAEILTPEQMDTLKTVMKAEREQKQTFRKEWNTYLDKEYKPMLKQKRAAFEAVLTAEEKAILAEFDKGKEKRGMRNKKDFKALEPILKNHQSELEQIEQELTAHFGDRLKVQGQLLQEKYQLDKNPAERLFGRHFKTKFLLVKQ